MQAIGINEAFASAAKIGPDAELPESGRQLLSLIFRPPKVSWHAASSPAPRVSRLVSSSSVVSADTCSALGSAKRDGAHDVFLKRQIKENDRKRCKNAARHHSTQSLGLGEVRLC